MKQAAVTPDTIASLNEGFDPMMGHMEATETASNAEEMDLADAMDSFREYLYSENGMSKVAQALQRDDRALYEKVPELLEPMLMKVKSDVESGGKIPDPSIWFGEGGILSQAVMEMFDLAAQLGLPGAQDEDQVSAALMGVYKKAGEHVLSEEDGGASKQEAFDLMSDMALTNPDGSMTEPDVYQKKHGGGLSEEIGTAVRGGGM